jgi:uncharacterized integral membrane protein (TIGR00698 family)
MKTASLPFSAPSTRWQGVQQLAPGLALVLALAHAGIALGQAPWFAAHGMSALTVAIGLGILVGNTLYPALAPACGAGVGFSKQTLLRAGVVLYGLRLTVQDIGQVGLSGIAIDALVLLSTFSLAYVLGTRLLKLDPVTTMLIGSGSAICGAAAVMATEPVVRARAEQVTVAVATVVVFGTVATFLYPWLYTLNQQWHWLPGGAQAFGLYAGSTIHEVAQVVAAGRSISMDAANSAVIAKMVRVMMLAPFLVGLSAWLARRTPAGKRGAAKVTVPWFAFGFIGVVLFNSLVALPTALRQTLLDLDTVLLAMAMAALGLSTHFSALRRAGLRPLLLAALLFGWLVIGGGLLNRLLG